MTQDEARYKAFELCNKYLQNYFEPHRDYNPRKVFNILMLLAYINDGVGFWWEDTDLITETVGWELAFNELIKDPDSYSYKWAKEYADDCDEPFTADTFRAWMEPDDEITNEGIYLILIEYLTQHNND